MKLVWKINLWVGFLALALLAFSVLLSVSFIKNYSVADKKYTDLVTREAYKHLFVLDTNGVPIYSGDFSDDALTRLSTFHIVGDKNGSIPDSLLTASVKDMIKTSIFTGYQPQDKTIQLTLDLSLQINAYAFLKKIGKNGCIVVSDYKTGEIKALVSTPSVDVLNPVVDKTSNAFLCKALEAYTPGSVAKSISIAAILEKYPFASTFEYYCSGKDVGISCPTPHGKVSLEEALYKSCNIGVGNAAATYLTAEELDDFYSEAGVTGANAVADLKAKKGHVNFAEDLMWSACGQGQDLLTPMSIVSFYSMIANRGVSTAIHVRQDTKSTEKRVVKEGTASFIVNALTKAMAFYGSPIACNAFGKTGTAERDGADSHAWFITCLSDDNAPDYTICVFIEGGGASSQARKYAADFINRYILK